MAEFNKPETGDKLEVCVEDDHLNAGIYDDTEVVESPSMETCSVNLDADTEELDIPDFVGNLRAQMVEDSGEEVVLDSDKEESSEQKGGRIRGHLRRRVSGVVAQSLEIYSSAVSLTDEAANCGPISVHPDPHNQEVFVGTSRERNPISSNQDGSVTDVDQDYSRQWNDDKMENRDMKRSSTGDDIDNSKAPCSNFGNLKAASVVTQDNVLAFGSCNESQEPGESSQANALDFVDLYVSVSGVHLPPETRIPKLGRLKSALVPCAKGSQNMARNANLMTKVGKTIFDWDEDQRDDGGDFYLKKKKELDIQTETHLDRRFKEELKGSVLLNSNETYSRLMNEFDEQNAYCGNELDEGFEEEPSRQLPENCSTGRDTPDVLDIGFDTQMAAEAMEALIHAPPPNINDSENEGPKNTLNDTLEGATKNTAKRYSPPRRSNCDLHIGGRKFKRKNVSNKSHDLSTPFNKRFKNQRESFVELPEIGKVARGNSLTETSLNGKNHVNPKYWANQNPSKVISLKKRKQHSEKENIQVGYNELGLSKPGKFVSDGQTQEEVKTFSPIACRTRRGSLAKPSTRTEDTRCNLRKIKLDMQVDALQKRKRGDLDTDSMSVKSIKCLEPSSSAPKETEKNSKAFQQRQNHPDVASTASTWKWPRQKRTHRNMRRNAKWTSNFCAISTVIEAGRGNGNSVKGSSESEGSFSLAWFCSSVKRKARSASGYQSSSGMKYANGLSMQKFSEQSLADGPISESVLAGVRMVPGISNEAKASSQSGKPVNMDSIPSIGAEEEKIKDVIENGKSKVLPVVSSGRNRKQLYRRNSSRSSLTKELTRLGCSASLPEAASKDLRRRRNKVDIRVLFSQSLDVDVIRQQRKVLAKLGTCVASDCSDATHFVTDRFVRTKNMLEALALGKPVVTHLWLESCGQANFFIDEKNYILRDAKKEKEIGFSMPVSLSRARAHPLLEDRRVFITPNVEPGKEMIVSLVKAVRGLVVEGIQRERTEYKENSDDLLILSCEQDYETCVPFLDKGAAVYSSELLLNGIIIQKLEYERHRLFKDHVKMKRYARRRRKTEISTFV